MFLLYVTGTKSTLCCSGMFFFIIENCQVLFFFTSLWRVIQHLLFTICAFGAVFVIRYFIEGKCQGPRCQSGPLRE